MASDYGAWNDYLGEWLSGRAAEWTVARAPLSVGPCPQWQSWVQAPEQVCLPYLLHEWVHEIRLLPTSGWDALFPDLHFATQRLNVCEVLFVHSLPAPSATATPAAGRCWCSCTGWSRTGTCDAR